VLRLPRLLHGWEILDAYGWDPARLEQSEDYRRSYVATIRFRGRVYTDDDGAVLRRTQQENATWNVIAQDYE
jgi:hypothetical protein